MRGGAFLKGKEGRVGFRKKGKEGRIGFRKILLLFKEERGVSKVHTFQSPHNLPTVSKMHSPDCP